MMSRRFNINDEATEKMVYFYQMPKFLFRKELEINSDAKVVYSLLKNRHNISTIKKRTNRQGDIVVIYPREKMAELLNVSVPTIRKAFQRLNLLGLIEEEKQGPNKPNLIYLTKVENLIDMSQEWDSEEEFYPKFDKIVKIAKIAKESIKDDSSEEYSHEEPVTPSLLEKEISTFVEESNIINFETEKNKITSQMEEKNLSLQEEESNNFSYQTTNGQKDSFGLDRKNLSGNKILKDLNNISLNNLSNQSNDLMDTIKNQIEFEAVFKPYNKKELNLIVEVMTETLSSKKGFVVSKTFRPHADIRDKLIELNQFHIEYVIECLQECRTEIRNIKSYILTALYNAPLTMDFYYDNKIKAMLG